MRNHGSIYIITAYISTSLLLSSCSLSSLKQESTVVPVPAQSEAIFEYFSYTGNDDFYSENPLQGMDNYYNPVLPGWYSDPSVCRSGDDYFLVTSTFSYFPGVPIFHSKDLVNWNQIGHILNRKSQLVNMEGQKVSGGIFAPAIEYNPHNSTYYMITTNVGAGNFFVKTQDPFGDWSDPIMLPEVGGIDPSFFFDEDGKAYIVNNDDAPGIPEYSGHRTIRIREFDVKSDKTIGKETVIVNKGWRPEDKPIWIEGPHLYKINGKYFLMAAEGGTSVWHSEVIFRSDNPTGPFIPWDKNPILTQRNLNPERPNPVTCAGHADLIQTKDGDWWAFFLACRPINNSFENLGRETFLMPVKWSEDGFPYMTQGEDIIPLIEKRSGITRNNNVTFGNYHVKDNFDNKELGMEWISLRGPIADLCDINDKSGYLTLKCSEVKSRDKKTPSFLARRMQHHKFECVTRMIFEPQENESAGMLLFKDEEHQYFFSLNKSGDDKKLSLIKIGENESESELASQTIKSKSLSIDLKVVSKGTSFDFYYSQDGNKWVELTKNVDASYLSTNVAGGFTGTTIGIYAVKE